MSAMNYIKVCTITHLCHVDAPFQLNGILYIMCHNRNTISLHLILKAAGKKQNAYVMCKLHLQLRDIIHELATLSQE